MRLRAVMMSLMLGLPAATVAAWQDDSSSPYAPDIDAQGQAEFAAHEGKIAFLKRVLSPARR